MIYMYIIHKYYCWQIIRTPKCFSLILNNNQNCLKGVLLKTLVSQRKTKNKRVRPFLTTLLHQLISKINFHTIYTHRFLYVHSSCVFIYSKPLYIMQFIFKQFVFHVQCIWQKNSRKNLYSCTSCNSSKKTPLDFILNCVQLHIPHESSFQNESIDIFLEYHTRLNLEKRSD